MKTSTSIWLRICVWLLGFFAVMGVCVLVAHLGLPDFWATLGALFIIFLGQGFSSLIPTRKEIRDRQHLRR